MNRVNIGSYSAKKGWNEKPKVSRKYKNKTKKPKLKKKLVFGIFFFITLMTCGVLFFNFANKVPGVDLPIVQPAKSLCTNILDPNCWTESFRPELRQTDGRTNMLIVGLDTRSNDSGLKNTDTIAVASFDQETKETMLISIPRDFYTPTYATKINAVYAFTSERDPEDPFKSLKGEVGAITGREIHYTTVVKFDAVTSIVEEFDGVEICPEAPFTAQYPNEDPQPGEGQWTYHEFEAGCQTVSGDDALIYSRFRYVSKGPSSLASDFSRARRQQEVIEAIKDKVLEGDASISDRASTFWKLFQNYQENVITDVAFQDILGALSLVSSASLDPLNIVLDPNFGSLNEIIYTDSSTGSYTIRPKDSSYAGIHKELDRILASGELYKENPKILVRNWGDTYLTSVNPVQELEKELPYKELYVYRNEFGKADFSGYKVIDLTDGKKPATLKVILDKLNLDKPSEQANFDIAQSDLGEDIVILVGKPNVTPTVQTTP